MKIEGRNAVLEALNSGATIDKLYIKQGAFDKVGKRTQRANRVLYGHGKQIGCKQVFRSGRFQNYRLSFGKSV